MKLVEITINSVIENLTDAGLPDGDPEINIITVTGSLRNDGGILHIGYTEENEGGKTECHLTYYPDGRVSLSRRGAIVSDIIFAEGEECNTVYSIPPYKFNMSVLTKRIRADINESGGTVQLIYKMNVGGQDKNIRMKLTVR